MKSNFPPCEEMLKLRKRLTETGIEWNDCSTEMMCQTRFRFGKLSVSVINGWGSYGGIRSGRIIDGVWKETPADFSSYLGMSAEEQAKIREKWNVGLLEVAFSVGDKLVGEPEGHLEAKNIIVACQAKAVVLKMKEKKNGKAE